MHPLAARLLGSLLLSVISGVSTAAMAAGLHLTTTEIGAAGVVGAIGTPILLELLRRTKRTDTEEALRLLRQVERERDAERGRWEQERAELMERLERRDGRRG